MEKQQDLIGLLPTEAIGRMLPVHWDLLYHGEDNSYVSDDGVFGSRQLLVSREHRGAIVQWLSEACVVLGWSSTTFFVAVNALDAYVCRTRHCVQQQELGPVAAAALYYGANLLESGADDNIYSLDRFMQLCPEVGPLLLPVCECVCRFTRSGRQRIRPQRGSGPLARRAAGEQLGEENSNRLHVALPGPIEICRSALLAVSQ